MTDDDTHAPVRVIQPDPITAYFAPIIEAATLLGLRPYPAQVEQVRAVLDKLACGYPRDVLPPLEALRMITTTGSVGRVEELEILQKVWPDWNGDVRYTLTATTLTWKWSSKHSGRYATITVPFPTILPLQVAVVRFCDMDDQANHSDECGDNFDDGSDCNCEGWVEQKVSATVSEWTDEVAGQLAAWLAQAVTEEAEAATFPVPPAAAAAAGKRTKRAAKRVTS